LEKKGIPFEKGWIQGNARERSRVKDRKDMKKRKAFVVPNWQKGSLESPKNKGCNEGSPHPGACREERGLAKEIA